MFHVKQYKKVEKVCENVSRETMLDTTGWRNEWMCSKKHLKQNWIARKTLKIGEKINNTGLNAVNNAKWWH